METLVSNKIGAKVRINVQVAKRPTWRDRRKRGTFSLFFSIIWGGEIDGAKVQASEKGKHRRTAYMTYAVLRIFGKNTWATRSTAMVSAFGSTCENCCPNKLGSFGGGL